MLRKYKSYTGVLYSSDCLQNFYEYLKNFLPFQCKAMVSDSLYSVAVRILIICGPISQRLDNMQAWQSAYGYQVSLEVSIWIICWPGSQHMDTKRAWQSAFDSKLLTAVLLCGNTHVSAYSGVGSQHMIVSC